MFSCLCDEYPCVCPRLDYSVPPSPEREERLAEAGISEAEVSDGHIAWRSGLPHRMATSPVRKRLDQEMLEGMTTRFVEALFA